ncbi:hypothetical protein BDU57DRAFT_521000 [Ampelomyces quisqualis]|uniref:BTB domain-containing protein n=1 Tax=Ampelomyces quisqualis TaxID=50730 RepID=A0A6A5QGF8_AMPQU|nr:hypothetical protein BDU57DRAFT_521000 [Ampelomyces quisqualis]
MSEATNQCSFSDLIQSDLFTFKIGEEQKVFVAHSAAIAATSEPFRALVNGGLKEAETRTAELKDVEPEDFARFLEYAYRHDYTVPSWVLDESIETTKIVEQEHDSMPESPAGPAQPGITSTRNPFGGSPVGHTAAASPPGPRGTSSPVLTEKKNGEVLPPQYMKTLRSNFQKRFSLNTAPIDYLLDDFEPKSNSAANQDFTSVFLAHARLYTFADMRLIHPLKELVLYKLHKTLMNFQLYNQRVGDVVQLARHAYDHGFDRSKYGRMDELRLMVVEYMACEVEIVGKHAMFMALLEDGGEFVTDFWRIVAKFLP